MSKNHIWIIEKNSSQELEEQGYQEILNTLNGIMVPVPD